ncbi:MAG: ATP-grasp fold amidoligase family protein [Propionibacteriales bacterium]|nr:ATP-grasp fold amidoligase family protein [Propionibacteriales bacterium]
MRQRPWTSVLEARALRVYHGGRTALWSRMSDEKFAQRSHRGATGVGLDLANPRTFDERQWWLKLHHRDPLMTQCTDKIGVRDYVESKGLGHLLIPLLAVHDKPEDIDWASLPDQFYVKTNNSSATNIRCESLAEFDTRTATKLLNVYLKRNHYALSREWNYRDIEPRIMIEPIIPSAGDSGLVDYRFLCSHGVCKAIFVDVDTADERGGHRGDARRNVYDPSWNLLDVRVTRPRILDREIEKPARLDDMIRYAELLSAPFPFCRVDLYSPRDDEVIFGEMTFFHAGGNNRVEPESFQLTMGSWIDMSHTTAPVRD